jgi:hypothetical protein
LRDIASILIVVDAAPELEDERRPDHRELSTRKSMPGRPDDAPFVREWLDLKVRLRRTGDEVNLLAMRPYVINDDVLHPVISIF